MPEYRRSHIEGGTYFFTVVTFDRQPILLDQATRHILHAAWETVQTRYPFKTDALCLLPNHIHCIWTLPELDSDYSLRWKEIKRLFTKQYLELIGAGPVSTNMYAWAIIARIWGKQLKKLYRAYQANPPMPYC